MKLKEGAHSYTDKGEKPEVGKYYGFHHASLWVGNAKQAAEWYCIRFGFKRIAYKGLETQSRETAHHVIKQNKIIYEFISPLNPGNKEFAAHFENHGDGVKVIAFSVDDCAGIYNAAIERGAKSVSAPEESSDEYGKVVSASIRTYGDTIHTFIQLNSYSGAYLPGYKPIPDKDADPLDSLTGEVGLNFIDHIVGNQPEGDMQSVAEWYEKVLRFHRFWSVDDKTMRTEYSALNSVVIADYDENIKMPLNEPAPGKRKSQIQEYVEYYNGAGVQHIAMNTGDIISAVSKLRRRGNKFLEVPDEYWINLKKRLEKSPVKVKEDLEELRKNKILVDYDDKGYLLQIFTVPTQDRPTLFYEVIQRNNHWGFGAGNFKALFKAIEDAQAARGNLSKDKGFGY